MIISHKYNFIFIRTRKVASSSLEMCLSKLLDENDFATHLSDRDHLLGTEYANLNTRIFRGFDKHFRPMFMNGHSPLKSAYRLFGRDIQDYKVISADRNPWDRAVSVFYWSNRRNDMKSRPMPEQIAAFQKYARENGPDNFMRRNFGWQIHRAFSQKSLYSLGDIPMVDFMLRFECLGADLVELSEYLKLPYVLSLKGFNAKRDNRSQKSRKYLSFYDDATRDLISGICQWEQDRFGYDFEGENMPEFVPDPARHEVKEAFMKKYAKPNQTP